jgi:hypothetical protein
MNLNKINRKINALEASMKAKEKPKPFSTLTKFENGEITAEEALVILKDSKEPFAKMSRIIIESALLSDEEKYKNSMI